MPGKPLPPSSPVTAAAIDRAFLAPGMDARARNLDQYDPSPGVDSQLERIRALALRLPPGPEREALISEVDATILSNSLEGTEILGINGDADRLVTDLRRIERNSDQQALCAKAIARHLREPLRSLVSDSSSTSERVTARRILLETIARVPRLMLLSAGVEHELGREKFALLERFTQESGAARSAAAGATEERWSAQHAEP